MSVSIQTSSEGRVSTLRIVGSVVSNVESVELREKISAAAHDGALWVVLDCTDLTFISSIGLGMIISSLTSLRNRGGDLCLSCINDDIVEILTKTLLTRVIQIFETTEEAIAACASRGA